MNARGRGSISSVWSGRDPGAPGADDRFGSWSQPQFGAVHRSTHGAMTTAESPLSRARLASRPIASRSVPAAPLTEADRAAEREARPPALTRPHVRHRGHPPGTPE
jgi:hypothetical protein